VRGYAQQLVRINLTAALKDFGLLCGIVNALRSGGARGRGQMTRRPPNYQKHA
jgi:hypothetical protein